MRPCATASSDARKREQPLGLDEAGSAPCHVVQFYETDVFLAATVANFLAVGLCTGQPVVVIATAAHCEAFGARMGAKGLDLEAAQRRGQLVWLDAHETLAALMVDGMPDAERFRAAIIPVLERSIASCERTTVRAYGEMVDLLWQEGNMAAALRLEALWNELADDYDFSLVCAYRMCNFGVAADGEGFREVCCNHVHVIPTERYLLADESDRLVEIAVLQQRARALQAEVEHRKDLERQLREALAEQERAHEQLRQRDQKLADAQRLESIGLLAGGIAHDFNNLLASVLGNADLLNARLAAGSEERALAEEIMLAAGRSADLTRQLLAYAGRGQFVLAPVDLGALGREVGALLRTAIFAGGTLALDVPQALLPVRGDRAQLTQVLMNLVTNAAEAIRAGGGTVSVRMTQVHLDEAAIAALAAEAGVLDRDLPAGDYVRVEVADTGVGMSPEVRARMFEPFFTTKPSGRGLGLAATRGIVHAHGGLLAVDSAVGRGTTVQVWLPVDGAQAALATPAAGPCPAQAAPGKPLARRTALVADDDAGVRRILGRMLAQQGFEVLEAEDGKEALAVADARGGALDLVLLDLTMPRLGGAEVHKAVAQRWPQIPVVLMSGYTEEPAEGDGARAGGAVFLEKPFERSAVMRAVALALGERRSA